MKKFYCLAVIIAAMIPLTAHSITWREAIEKVEKNSEALWKEAHDRGFEGRWIGTMYNEVNMKQHRCSILGRMLGMPKLILEVEKSADFDLTGDEVISQDFAVAGHSLEVWVMQAKDLLATNRQKRVREWNLDCVGYLGIPESAWLPDVAQTFYDVEDNVLRIFGDVEIGFSDRVREALDTNPDITAVALGSGGGVVIEALEAGSIIRKKGLETTLWNNCYSACPIVFIGGKKRIIWSPYPGLFFHQVSGDGKAVPFDHRIYAKIASYAREMGVDSREFLRLIMSASPYTFTRGEEEAMCNSEIATWVQRRCASESQEREYREEAQKRALDKRKG